MGDVPYEIAVGTDNMRKGATVSNCAIGIGDEENFSLIRNDLVAILTPKRYKPTHTRKSLN